MDMDMECNGTMARRTQREGVELGLDSFVGRVDGLRWAMGDGLVNGPSVDRGTRKIERRIIYMAPTEKTPFSRSKV